MQAGSDYTPTSPTYFPSSPPYSPTDSRVITVQPVEDTLDDCVFLSSLVKPLTVPLDSRSSVSSETTHGVVATPPPTIDYP